MISDTEITKIFCLIDDFMKEYDCVLQKNSISEDSVKKKRNRKKGIERVGCLIVK
jgi:hypothetical protein